MLQFTAFDEADQRGFGLLQRERAFEDFGDLQVPYERRPSAWVEPVGSWGLGALDLVEIPTATEFNDNIVAFWRGRAPLLAGSEHQFTYRLHWGETVPGDRRLARLRQMRLGGSRKAVVVVLDFGGESLRGVPIRVVTGSSAGTLKVGYSGPNGLKDGWRVSLEFDPGDRNVADLSCRLVGNSGAVAEEWRYRWIRVKGQVRVIAGQRVD